MYFPTKAQLSLSYIAQLIPYSLCFYSHPLSLSSTAVLNLQVVILISLIARVAP